MFRTFRSPTALTAMKSVSGSLIRWSGLDALRLQSRSSTPHPTYEEKLRGQVTHALNLVGVAQIDRDRLDAEGGRDRLDRAEHPGAGGYSRIPKDRRARNRWRDLF